MKMDARRDEVRALPGWLRDVRPSRRILTGRAYAIAKRLIDVSLVVLSAPAWVPLLCLCAVAVKLDSPGGPVLFSQPRTGFGGRPFKILKLRTMVPNAEALKQQLARQNERRWPDFKIENDPRITAVGAFLRKTSLDELPQLINVLRGDMSLVGPRPTSFAASTYVLWQTERLDVKPGITGLWQIVGRGDTEFVDRTRLDIAYVQRCSIMVDLRILIHTIPEVLAQRGAA